MSRVFNHRNYVILHFPTLKMMKRHDVCEMINQARVQEFLLRQSKREIRTQPVSSVGAVFAYSFFSNNYKVGWGQTCQNAFHVAALDISWMDIWINNHLVDEPNKMNKSHHVKPGRKLPLSNSLAASLKINSFLSTYGMKLDKETYPFCLASERQMKSSESKQMKTGRKQNKRQNQSLTHWHVNKLE